MPEENKIKEYIRLSLKTGKTKEQITKEFLKRGYSQKEAKKLINQCPTFNPKIIIAALVVTILILGAFWIPSLSGSKADKIAETAWILHNNAQFQEAIQQFEEVLEIDPSHGEANRGMIWTYHELKNTDKSIEYYNQLIELNPQEIGHKEYTRIGRMYYEKKDYNQSVEAINKSIIQNPEAPADYLTFGWALFKLGEIENRIENYELALESLEKAIQILNKKTSVTLEEIKQLSLAHEGIARIYWVYGDFKKAEEEMRIASNLDPENKKFQEQLEKIQKKISAKEAIN